IGGGSDYNTKGVGLSKKDLFPKINGTFGLEYMIRNKLGLFISSGLDYYLNDSFDGSIAGQYNDLGWNISVGLKIYMIDFKHKK
ncbi:MAG TPA: hypothetical protein VI413_00460, partial [Paludibacter sp.]